MCNVLCYIFGWNVYILKFKNKKHNKINVLVCFNWCPEEDSNLHALQHRYLKPARLPIPPSGHCVPSKLAIFNCQPEFCLAHKPTWHLSRRQFRRSRNYRILQRQNGNRNGMIARCHGSCIVPHLEINQWGRNRCHVSGMGCMMKKLNSKGLADSGMNGIRSVVAFSKTISQLSWRGGELIKKWHETAPMQMK